MKQKNILITLLSVTVLFFASCKIEETTSPSSDITLGSGSYTLVLEADLDYTNDTNGTGGYLKTYEPMTDVFVSASINRSQFYSSTSGNYEDEVVTGTTGADGRVTLSLPVGQRSNIYYSIRIGDKFVMQKISNDKNIEPLEKLAYNNNGYSTQMSKGASEIQKVRMQLQ